MLSVFAIATDINCLFFLRSVGPFPGEVQGSPESWCCSSECVDSNKLRYVVVLVDHGRIHWQST